MEGIVIAELTSNEDPNNLLVQVSSIDSDASLELHVRNPDNHDDEDEGFFSSNSSDEDGDVTMADDDDDNDDDEISIVDNLPTTPQSVSFPIATTTTPQPKFNEHQLLLPQDMIDQGAEEISELSLDTVNREEYQFDLSVKNESLEQDSGIEESFSLLSIRPALRTADPEPSYTPFSYATSTKRFPRRPSSSRHVNSFIDNSLKVNRRSQWQHKFRPSHRRSISHQDEEGQQKLSPRDLLRDRALKQIEGSKNRRPEIRARVSRMRNA